MHVRNGRHEPPEVGARGIGESAFVKKLMYLHPERGQVVTKPAIATLVNEPGYPGVITFAESKHHGFCALAKVLFRFSG